MELGKRVKSIDCWTKWTALGIKTVSDKIVGMGLQPYES